MTNELIENITNKILDCFDTDYEFTDLDTYPMFCVEQISEDWKNDVRAVLSKKKSEKLIRKILYKSANPDILDYRDFNEDFTYEPEIIFEKGHIDLPEIATWDYTVEECVKEAFI